MQFVNDSGQRDAGIGRATDQATELGALRFPLLQREQVGGRVGIAA
nr:hypothetical protein [Nocardia carnea]